VALAVAIAAGISAFAATAVGAKPEGKKAGSIEVLSLWGGSEKAAFLKVTSAFTKATGITVKYTTARDFEPAIQTRLTAGDPPDIAIIPRPGDISLYAKQGAIKDLGKLGMTKAYLAAHYSKALRSLGTVGGKVVAVPAKGNSKSVVWYHPSSFRANHFKVPNTWAQLLSITKKYKAKGKTPWAVGAKDSWTLTDWFENVYIRTAGPAKYLSLFTGKTKFTDPSVKKALSMVEQIVQNKYLPGGVSGALGTAFVDGIGDVFGKKPSAQMYMEGGFVGGIATQQVNTSLKPGKDINEFPFPTITPKWGKPVTYGGDFAAAFKDNDGVRKFLKFITSKAAGTIWVSTGAVVSPNKSVSPKAYPNALVRFESHQIATSKYVLFDGSDLLPGTLADDWGAALQNIVQKPADASSILSAFQKKADKAFKP
jgi:ABC-type glycerol-3-phosphate transport system substrate-binding protein